MRRVCLVTNELYPLHRGGIGRLMYNFARHNAEHPSPVDLHILVDSRLAHRAAELESAFAGLARIHLAPAHLARVGLPADMEARLRSRDSLEERYVDSLRYYVGLVEAEERIGAPFDVIEFPDLGGWAGCSLAARECGMAFRNATITVRLHSSFTLIYDAEPGYHIASSWVAAVADFERKALRDCDLIIGHLPSVIDLNVRTFRLAHAAEGRAVTERPPVILDPEEEAAPANGHGMRRRAFVFSSRIQPFKRPDVFVRAAIFVCDGGRAADAEFIVASYGWDRDYVASLQEMIPVEYADRIRFAPDLPKQERVALMRDAVVVIPSRFESYCVFAYECAMRGTSLVLAGDCDAFSDEAGWIDGENCTKFDGTPEDLARIFEKSGFPGGFLRPEQTQSRDLYWHGSASRTPRVQEGPDPAMVAVRWGFRDLLEMMRAVKERRTTLAPFERVVFTLARRHLGHADVPELAASLERTGVILSVTPDGLPDAALLHRVADGAGATWLLTYPAGWAISAEFITAARAAIRARPDLVCFTSPVKLINQVGVVSWEVYIGEQSHLSMYFRGSAPPVTFISIRVLSAMQIEDYKGSWVEGATTDLALREGALCTTPAPLLSRTEDTGANKAARSIATALARFHSKCHSR